MLLFHSSSCRRDVRLDAYSMPVDIATRYRCGHIFWPDLTTMIELFETFTIPKLPLVPQAIRPRSSSEVACGAP